MLPIDRERWAVLEPLLDHALELSGPERAAWLAELSLSSPDVASEISALLSGELSADREGFLAGSLELPPPTSLEGMQLGAWTVVRPIGQGGMGSVWLARRADGRFEGQAAVKLLNLSLLTPAGQERFRREGSTLARLTHPAIARLLDAGVAPSGQPYLVLEYVEGRPIDEHVRAAALGPREVVRLVLEVLEAVEHAHANLVVHRDLKPSNILVTPDGRVKLLDFGIAKLLDPDDGVADRSALTMEGGRALTPRFAAPEQVRGEPVTTATDVYACGVLLYLLLSGRHPTAEGCRTPAEMIAALFERRPANLGLGDLDVVLGKALRPAPAERYFTASGFAADLGRWLAHEPVSARPDSLVYRARKFVRRNRAGVVAAGLVAAALVGATAFSVAQMQEAQRQRDAARRDALLSQALIEVQRVVADDERGADGVPISTAQRIARAERVLATNFGDQPWLVADVLIQLATQLYESDSRDAGRAMLARAREVATRGGSPAHAAHASCQRAYSFAYDDQLDSARASLAAAKAVLAGTGEPPDLPTESVCLVAAGKVLAVEGKSDSAVALLERAVGLRRQANVPPMAQISALNDLAEILRLSVRTRAAAAYQAEVLDLLERRGTGGADAHSNVLASLTHSLYEMGELAAADSTVAIAMRHVQAAGAPLPMQVMFLRALTLVRLGRLEEAERWIGRFTPDTVNAVWRRAWLPAALTDLRLRQGRLADARRELVAVTAGSRGRRATLAWLQARVQYASGDTGSARAALERELHELTTDGKLAIPHFAPPLTLAAQWRLAGGDASGADSLAALALRYAAIDSLALERSAHAGEASLVLARSRLALGDRTAALTAARRSRSALGVGYGAGSSRAAEAAQLADSLARLDNPALANERR